MEFLVNNLFFILILLFCVGVHLFGHGHGGHGDGANRSGRTEHTQQPGQQHRRH